jgi:hypothetical protein
MRRHPGTDDFDLPNGDEIEAALNAALDRSLDDLLTIEEFAEKFAPIAETPDEPLEVAAEDDLEIELADSDAGEPSTLAFPSDREDETGISRAA